ncbi:MAG TPA: PfkB family carbohydrate kinase [Sphaerochaetaceae bacterium]|nr:PfkB family carbohydrate kinase [Sphaerochaetaceae bacterium]
MMIAILGEALIDLIGGKGEDGQDCFYHFAGGCALNAATAAARLGSHVLYIGKLSSDMFGTQMQQYFTDNSVSMVDQFRDVPNNSMIGFAKLDSTGSASYVFYTEGTTVTKLTDEEITQALDAHPQISYLHIGSVSVALDESGEHILRALEKRDDLPFVFFDPNVRPTIIANLDTYRKRVIALVKLSTLVKLSHEDLEMIFPVVSVEEGIQKLLHLGVEHVILTKGKDGLQWRSQSGLDVSIPAIDNPIVDTVGAGDTVSGAVLTYLNEQNIQKGDTVTEAQAQEALRFAALAAAVTTSRKGANPPKRNEVGMFKHLEEPL